MGMEATDRRKEPRNHRTDHNPCKFLKRWPAVEDDFELSCWPEAAGQFSAVYSWILVSAKSTSYHELAAGCPSQPIRDSNNPDDWWPRSQTKV